MDGVKRHLAAHYADFDETPPWEQQGDAADSVHDPDPKAIDDGLKAMLTQTTTERDQAIAERDVALAGLDKSTTAVSELTVLVEQKSRELSDAQAELEEIRPKAALADALLAERKTEIEHKAKAASVDALVGDLAEISDLERLTAVEKAVSAAFDEKFPPQGRVKIPTPGADTKEVAAEVVIGGPPR
jgi:hypothetical protein